MEPVSTFMLAMQAAGMITDFLGTKQQASVTNRAMEVQQAGLETNLAQMRLESADASLQSMKQLRQTLGSQISTFATRGTRTDAGSSVGILNQSIGNFNTDERVRKLNLLGKQTALKGNSLISSLQNSSDVSKLWQGFASRTFNNFPTSLAGWGGGKSNNEGFGLTKVGS